MGELTISVVCILVHSDVRYRSGQNVVDSRIVEVVYSYAVTLNQYTTTLEQFVLVKSHDFECNLEEINIRDHSGQNLLWTLSATTF